MTFKNVSTETSEHKPESPKWNWTTKLLVGLALIALSVWLLVQFQNFLGPLISALVLSYLLHPIAAFINEKIKLPWRLSVTLVYLVLVAVLMGMLTWGGLTVVDQIQNLIRFIENNVDQLPDLVSEITSQIYEIGPFTFTPSEFNWDQITNEIVGTIQPVLGQLGNFASSIATGAANIFSWLVLILLISYFLLAESEGIPNKVLNIKIPGYSKDIEKLGDELSVIWNAFIRGEVLIVIVSLIMYTIALGGMRLQFFFGLAVIASVGQLIPYVGAWITWISFGLVALFQTNIPFDAPPGVYMLIVLGVSMIINTIIDNILRTKIMAANLKVHPVMVLLGALIGVQLIGFIGIIIAAPIMASLKLFLNYVFKKLNDRNPWEDYNLREEVERSPWQKFTSKKWTQLKEWTKKTWLKLEIPEIWENFTGWIARIWHKLFEKAAEAHPEKEPSDKDQEEPSSED